MSRGNDRIFAMCVTLINIAPPWAPLRVNPMSRERESDCSRGRPREDNDPKRERGSSENTVAFDV